MCTHLPAHAYRDRKKKKTRIWNRDNQKRSIPDTNEKFWLNFKNAKYLSYSKWAEPKVPWILFQHQKWCCTCKSFHIPCSTIFGTPFFLISTYYFHYYYYTQRELNMIFIWIFGPFLSSSWRCLDHLYSSSSFYLLSWEQQQIDFKAYQHKYVQLSLYICLKVIFCWNLLNECVCCNEHWHNTVMSPSVSW